MKIGNACPYEAKWCHGTNKPFVTIQPVWSLSPDDTCDGRVQVASVYFMRPEHAREVAKQLIEAADAADASQAAEQPEAAEVQP